MFTASEDSDPVPAPVLVGDESAGKTPVENVETLGGDYGEDTFQENAWIAASITAIILLVTILIFFKHIVKKTRKTGNISHYDLI